MQQQASFQPSECQLRDLKLLHSLLYLTECPAFLLGWHLLYKLSTQVTFSPERHQLHQQDP